MHYNMLWRQKIEATIHLKKQELVILLNNYRLT